MDVLHGDDLSQFIQAVHILDLIQELHTAEENVSFFSKQNLNIHSSSISKMKNFWHRPCLKQHFLIVLCYLIKGLDIARTVRMNHVGWAMTKDLRFFLSLQSQHKHEFSIALSFNWNSIFKWGLEIQVLHSAIIPYFSHLLAIIW